MLNEGGFYSLSVVAECIDAVKDWQYIKFIQLINRFRPRQNGKHVTNGISNCILILSNENI